MGRSIALVTLAMALAAAPSTADVVFYTSEAAFTADADAATVESFDTGATALAQADELGAPPAQDENMGPVLGFDAANTGLCGSFTLEALQSGAGLTFEDGEPSPAIFPPGTISIGDIDDFEDDDFRLRFPTNSFFAVGFTLINDTQDPGESLRVYGESGPIAVLDGASIPDTSGNGSTFLGVVADEPITQVVFDEDPSGDDIAIRDLRLGCALADPDADGLVNLAERAAGTLPGDADSDADGLQDGDELGTGGFGPQQVISNTSNGVNSVYAADLDGDGDRDVLAASQFDDTVAWFENTDGKGSFGAANAFSTDANGALAVIAADLDGDGDLDPISASSFDNRIGWYPNDGSGGMGTRINVTILANGAASAGAADLDDDGDLDVLSASFGDNRIAWYENTNGLGSFGAQQTLTTSAFEAQWVSAADLDRDGDADALSASQADNEIAWYENLGAGSFTAHVLSNAAVEAQVAIAADIDGDGDLDVVSASRGDDRIAWFENLGGGSFAAPQDILTTASGVESVFAVDMDGDGDVDLVYGASLSNSVSWLENDGTGTFSSHGITGLTQRVQSVFAADVDGDGDPDVLSASRTDDKVAWYEQLNVADPLDPDTDGDGLLDGFEVDHGFDPLVPGEQTGDPDMDGLDNLGEQLAGTDPFVADTDGDGFSDGVEVNLGSDPLDPLDFPPPKVPGPGAPALALLFALLGGIGAAAARRAPRSSV